MLESIRDVPGEVLTSARRIADSGSRYSGGGGGQRADALERLTAGQPHEGRLTQDCWRK